MNLSGISVRRPVTTVMMTMTALILGFVSLVRLPIDLLPEIEVPVAIVTSNYPGAGPKEVEKIVTSPIEEIIATVSNVEDIRSISYEGNSIVVAEFAFNTDMDFASLEMREKVDMIKDYLPEDVDDPIVMKIDPNAFPIMQISLSGDYDLANLQNFAEDIVKPRLERLDGIASVDVSGGYDRQVEIVVPEHYLSGYGLSVDYIAGIIGAENLNLPGGRVKQGKQELTVKIKGEFTSLEEIESLPIALPTGGSVHLGDIAEIGIGYKEIDSIAKLNGENCINISVQKESGKNTVDVSETVNREMDKIKAEYSGRKFEIILDQAEFINMSVNNVKDSALLGGILAILILYLFFRNIRSTFIIGTAIPVSFIATFALMYFNGITLNMMTLGGLALGVGMLVDNSIVVLENIYRFREEGFSKKDAAIKGASEVGMAVTASTLTTVAVFLPIVFVEGITSTLFKELALTVTFSLLASLVVSLTLIPMLSSKILNVYRGAEKKRRDRKRLLALIYELFDRAFRALDSAYRKLLDWSLRHRKSTIAIGIIIFLISMASILTLGAEYFPETDEGQFTVSISLPEGAELDDTEAIVTRIEGMLEDIEEINTVYSNMGSFGNRFVSAGTTNVASIDVLLVDIDKRLRSTAEVVDRVRGMVRDIAGAEIGVEVSSMMMMGFGGDPISINIKGDDFVVLDKIGTEFSDIVKSVEGTREVDSNYNEGVPEVRAVVDRQSASRFGLTAAQIANSVKNALSGKTAARYRYDGDEIDILLRGDDIFGESISNLGQLTVLSSSGSAVPLNQVAVISVEKGPASINRSSQSRVVTVSGQIFGRSLSEVSRDIETKLEAYKLPAGYSYEIEGQRKELNMAFSDLYLALGLAVVLVYMVLASQFESLLHPFTILLCVPLSLSGGALALFITRRTLNLSSLIGAIILTGIAVNDAIVFIDYINTRRKSGENRMEAIKNAGPIRLRPILITTLTTVLGLLPMAIGLGEGSELLSPMATVVIGGLSMTTLLTLIFIPNVYTLLDDLADWIKRSIFGRKGSLLPEEGGR